MEAVEGAGDTPAGSVLVVDDEAMNRELLYDLLEIHGYAVDLAENGTQALEMADSTDYDVVLLDVMMPGLDGFCVCERLRQSERSRAVNVLMVTALADRADRLRAIEAGATDFLTKPIDTHEVTLRVRNAVRQSQQMRALERLNVEKNRLLGMAAHDLRNPLAVVAAYSKLLMTQADGFPNSVVRALSAVERSTVFMQRLVDNMLDLSTIEAGQLQLNPESTDLLLLARTVVEQNRLLANSKGIEIVLEVAGQAPLQGTVDVVKIEQVLNNLITNAVKFSRAGQGVRVCLGATSETVIIRVIDEGDGIEPEVAEHLFKPFAISRKGTANEKGSGLGLAIVNRIIRGHGGAITVDSISSRGTTFTVELPIHCCALPAC